MESVKRELFHHVSLGTGDIFNIETLIELLLQKRPFHVRPEIYSVLLLRGWLYTHCTVLRNPRPFLLMACNRENIFKSVGGGGGVVSHAICVLSCSHDMSHVHAAKCMKMAWTQKKQSHPHIFYFRRLHPATAASGGAPLKKCGGTNTPGFWIWE